MKKQDEIIRLLREIKEAVERRPIVIVQPTPPTVAPWPSIPQVGDLPIPAQPPWQTTTYPGPQQTWIRSQMASAGFTVS